MEMEIFRLDYEAKMTLLRILQAGEATSKQLDELLKKLKYPFYKVQLTDEQFNEALEAIKPIEVRPPINNGNEDGND